MEIFALGERVANLEVTRVGQTDDVAGIGHVDGALALRHELGGRRETHGLTRTDVQVGGIAHKLTRTYLTEGYARAVVGVDISGNLEDEAGELLFGRHHLALYSSCGAWAGSNLYEAVEQLLHTEVIER